MAEDSEGEKIGEIIILLPESNKPIIIDGQKIIEELQRQKSASSQSSQE
jgi:hypothetical protein